MIEEMRLNHIQAALGSLFSSITDPTDYTPQKRFDRHTAEHFEARAASLEYDGSVEKSIALADECADLIITTLGVLHALGVDAERVIEDKMNVIYRKYNPTQHLELVTQGLSHKEATHTLKESWVIRKQHYD